MYSNSNIVFLFCFTLGCINIFIINHYQSPEISREGLLFSSPLVRPSVRSSGRFWANRLLLFSEILPKVAPQYLVVHLRFSIFLKISIPRFQPILAIFQGFSNILGKPRISFFSNFHTSSSRVIGYPLQQPIVCKKSSSWLKSRFCHQKTPNQQQIIHCFWRNLVMRVLTLLL